MPHHKSYDRYNLTKIIYPALENEQNGPYITHFVKDKAAELTFTRVGIESSFSMPVMMSSLELFREKDKRDIRILETVLADVKKERDEAKMARVDAETKWTETVGELDNARNQLREVRTANSQLLNANSCQSSRIQALESQLNLLKHQYEGKCQVVRELQTTGAAKERDEYSKALEKQRQQYYNTLAEVKRDAASQHQFLQTKFEQATKEAKKWKETATTRAKEIERLANLVIERTNTANSLAGLEELVEPYKTGPAITFGNVSELHVSSWKPERPVKLARPLTVEFKWDQGWGLPATIAGPTLVDRVSTLEAKVEKLENPPVPAVPAVPAVYRELDSKERVEEDDQYYNPPTDTWVDTSLAGFSQQYGLRYRRKV